MKPSSIQYTNLPDVGHKDSTFPFHRVTTLVKGVDINPVYAPHVLGLGLSPNQTRTSSQILYASKEFGHIYEVERDITEVRFDDDLESLKF